MRRRHLIQAVLILAVAGASAPAGASAAVDPTSTNVSCAPEVVTTGKAMTCTATVTDTVATPTTPTGIVNFTSTPGTGTFGSGGSCSLVGGTTAGVATCGVSFTPRTGGSYTVNATYTPDLAHVGSTGADSTPSSLDQMTMALACEATKVSVGDSTRCTATLSDANPTRQPPVSTVKFSASPTGSELHAAGVCQWHPSATGGTATCAATFNPAAAVTYTLSAQYAGDGAHQASNIASTTVTGTTTLSGGGPGSHGGGTGTLTISVSPGPPAPGTLSIAPRGAVSRKHAAAVLLTCSGKAPSRCAGALTLTTRVKVKVKVKILPKHGGKGTKKHKKGKRHRKVRTRTKTVTRTILVGMVIYNVGAGSAQTVSVRLTRGARKALAKARHHRIRVQALAANSFRANLILSAKKQRKHHRHAHKKHHRRHKKK